MTEPIDVAAAAAETEAEFLAGVKGAARPTDTSVEGAAGTLAQVPAVAVALDRVADAAACEVADRKGFNKAAELVATLARGLREAETYKKNGRAPMRKALIEFDSACNEVIGQLTSARSALSERMAMWSRAEEVLNAQMAEDAKAATEELNRQWAEKARAAGLPEPPPVEMYIAPPPKTTATPESGGKVTMTTRWTYEVEDAAKVPREFCAPSPGLIYAAVQRGVRSIPGVRIFQTESAGYRT